MFARMKVLMTNTSTPYHRGDMMNASGHVYAMNEKMHLSTDTKVWKTILSYP